MAFQWDPRFDDFIERTRVVTKYRCKLCMRWITNKSKDCVPAHLGCVDSLRLPPGVSYNPSSQAKELLLPIAKACWRYFGYMRQPAMFDKFAVGVDPVVAGVPAGASIPPEQEDDLLASMELEGLVASPSAQLFWNEEPGSPHLHSAEPSVLPQTLTQTQPQSGTDYTPLRPAQILALPQPQHQSGSDSTPLHSAEPPSLPQRQPQSGLDTTPLQSAQFPALSQP
ncbi:hypothetical protein CRG98_041995 [Punica granatum]|uniref:Uncharacterized protein n=1 Tax=Punica granatum TaxID=22663 RepID=A0A2I0I178_PUNGR|nr:hypothetical protein CRG98_041995 [Punica granatum]